MQTLRTHTQLTFSAAGRRFSLSSALRRRLAPACLLACLLTLGLPDSARGGETLYQLRQRAEQGNARALFDLGSKYIYGINITADVPRGLGYLRRAADQGYVQGQLLLARLHFSGSISDGVPDYTTAWSYFHAAAQNAANSYAMFSLGFMHARGLGRPVDHVSAVRWYQKAAVHGYAPAAYNLGLLYTQGRGVSRDSTRGLYWLNQAAAAGNGDALFALAVRALGDTDGTDRSHRLSMHYLARAVIAGHPDAPGSLATLLLAEPTARDPKALIIAYALMELVQEEEIGLTSRDDLLGRLERPEQRTARSVGRDFLRRDFRYLLGEIDNL